MPLGKVGEPGDGTTGGKCSLMRPLDSMGGTTLLHLADNLVCYSEFAPSDQLTRMSGHSRRNGAAQQHWGAQYPQTLRPAPGLTADPANLARSQEIQFRADVEEFVPGRAVHGNKAPKA